MIDFCKNCVNTSIDDCKICIDNRLICHVLTISEGRDIKTYTLQSHRDVCQTDDPIFIVSVKKENMFVAGNTVNGLFNIYKINSIRELYDFGYKALVECSELDITDMQALIVERALNCIVKRVKVNDKNTQNLLNKTRQEYINLLIKSINELEGYSCENVKIVKGVYWYKGINSSEWKKVNPRELLIQDLLTEINYLEDIIKITR